MVIATQDAVALRKVPVALRLNFRLRSVIPPSTVSGGPTARNALLGARRLVSYIAFTAAIPGELSAVYAKRCRRSCRSGARQTRAQRHRLSRCNPSAVSAAAGVRGGSAF